MSTKICQICGQEKSAEAFSKSYPHRCRECVAGATRDRRQAAKMNGLEGKVIITDEPRCMPIAPPTIYVKPHPDWEARHFDLALALFHRFLDGCGSNAEEAARIAKEAADEFINIMQDKDQ